MHLTNLNLKNFKKFQDAKIDLSKKIIVLVGPNSSGKTSIIKSILGLKQTLSSENDRDHFLAKGAYVDLGSYEDYIYDHDTKLDMMYEGIIENGNKLIRNLGFTTKKIGFQLVYGFDDDLKQSVLKKIVFDIFHAGGKASIRIEKKKTGSDFVVDYKSIYDIADDSSVVDLLKRLMNSNLRTSKFEVSIQDNLKIIPKSTRTPTMESVVEGNVVTSIIGDLLKVVQVGLDENIYYIGPLREKPQRVGVKQSMIKYVGVSGEYTPSVLSNLYSYNGKRRIFEDVNASFFSLFEKKIKVKSDDELAKVWIESDGRLDSISDVGFGVSQILPIITQIKIMDDGKTLILEQPELHLHPETQTKLASLIVEAANDGRKFIIETHSEHLVRGFQLAVNGFKKAKGVDHSLSSDDIDILYVGGREQEGGGGIIKRLRIDENGNFIEKWPPGFFDQAFNFSRTILGV